MGILGPMFGYMLGSFLAKLYVDIGFVNLGMALTVMILGQNVQQDEFLHCCAAAQHANFIFKVIVSILYQQYKKAFS